MDGNMARNYNMITIFGDYYDHFTDWIHGTLIIVFIIMKIKGYFNKILFFILKMISYYFIFLYISCQEKYLSLTNKLFNSMTNIPLIKYCKGNFETVKEKLLKLKWVGYYQYIFLDILILYLLENKLI